MCDALGKFHLQGLTLLQVTKMSSNGVYARKWIEELRQLDVLFCPHCASFNVQCNI